MTKQLIIFCLLVFNISNAQYQVKNLSTNEDEIFPLVTISNKRIEDNINEYLHTYYLENVYKSSKNPFDKVYNLNGNKRSYFHEYEIKQNTIPVFSLSILSEYCGAYCEENFEFTNFDLNNGNVITINDLIDSKMSNKLSQLLNKKTRDEITSFIRQIPNQNEINKEDLEYYTDQKAMYSECLNSIDTYNLKDTGFNFYINNDSIYFQSGRCSNHAMRALDEIGNFTYGFSKKEIEPYLSEYGKGLYGNLPRKMTDLTDKIFVGKIGKYPIKGVLNKYDSGFYWYEKTKQLISFDYLINDSEIIIKEKDHEDNYTAEFKLKRQNNQVIGTWKKNNKKDGLPVELNFNL